MTKLQLIEARNKAGEAFAKATDPAEKKKLLAKFEAACLAVAKTTTTKTTKVEESSSSASVPASSGSASESASASASAEESSSSSSAASSASMSESASASASDEASASAEATDEKAAKEAKAFAAGKLGAFRPSKLLALCMSVTSTKTVAACFGALEGLPGKLAKVEAVERDVIAMQRANTRDKLFASIDKAKGEGRLDRVQVKTLREKAKAGTTAAKEFVQGFIGLQSKKLRTEAHEPDAEAADGAELRIELDPKKNPALAQAIRQGKKDGLSAEDVTDRFEANLKKRLGAGKAGV